MEGCPVRAVRPDPQPAVAVLALRRITRRQIQLELGMSEDWLRRQLNGYAEPCRPLRAALPTLLGLPESELFRPGPVDEASE